LPCRNQRSRGREPWLPVYISDSFLCPSRLRTGRIIHNYNGWKVIKLHQLDSAHTAIVCDRIRMKLNKDMVNCGTRSIRSQPRQAGNAALPRAGDDGRWVDYPTCRGISSFIVSGSILFYGRSTYIPAKKTKGQLPPTIKS
jgi:hypothetical protein